MKDVNVSKIVIKRCIEPDGTIVQKYRLDPPDMPISEVFSMIEFAKFSAWDDSILDGHCDCDECGGDCELF